MRPIAATPREKQTPCPNRPVMNRMATNNKNEFSSKNPMLDKKVPYDNDRDSKICDIFPSVFLDPKKPSIEDNAIPAISAEDTKLA